MAEVDASQGKFTARKDFGQESVEENQGKGVFWILGEAGRSSSGRFNMVDSHNVTEKWHLCWRSHG